MTYKEKLLDPRWQKKRLQILDRDGWRCRVCSNEKANLQVHHVIYAKLDPWEYPDHLLQTLCRDCHESRQELTDKASNALRIAIAKIPTERIEKVATRLISEAVGEVGE